MHFKDLDITKDNCKKNRQKSQTTQQITETCCVLSEGDGTHRYDQVAIKWGLPK